MSRKYSIDDREIFRQIYVQFAAQVQVRDLCRMVRVLATSGALAAKWGDFHEATASRWITTGKWRDQVEAVAQLVQADQPLPTDDAIDDLVMRVNLEVYELLSGRIRKNKAAPGTALRTYIDLQREIRQHVQARMAIPLTPVQLIDLFLRAGRYAAGKAFDEDKGKEFLISAFSKARQLLPAYA